MGNSTPSTGKPKPAGKPKPPPVRIKLGKV
jgi:hypothetical protein